MLATHRALLRDTLDPEEATRIRTAVDLGIAVDDARFREALAAMDLARRKGGRRRKD